MSEVLGEYKSLYRAYRIVGFMRWITLMLGPIWFLGLDDKLIAAAEGAGIDLWNFDRLLQWMIVGLSLPIDLSVLEIPVQIVCTGLMVVFFIWASRLKKQVKNAASDHATSVSAMTYGDELIY